MSTIEITADLGATARAIGNDGPISMLNLLRYREHADYAGRKDIAPCTGREAYHQRYRAAFAKLAPVGLKVVWFGGVVAGIAIPDDERWDDVAIVGYPSFSAFRQVVESAAYAEHARPHRVAALADWRLIAMTEVDLG